METRKSFQEGQKKRNCLRDRSAHARSERRASLQGLKLNDADGMRLAVRRNAAHTPGYVMSKAVVKLGSADGQRLRIGMARCKAYAPLQLVVNSDSAQIAQRQPNPA